MKIEKPKLIFVYCNKLYFTYKRKYVQATSYNGTPMHGWDESAVYIGFENKMFGFDDLYYDGHTIKSITLFGITIGKYFSYTWAERTNDQ